jgi:mannan endo-1,4-beta-mannosidase
MITRRTLLASGAALAGGCAAGIGGGGSGAGEFVRVDGTRFTLGGRTYRFAGANMWYAAWLGADAAFGNRARLRRELDALAAIGVTNLRILGGAETSPLKGAISPAFRGPGSDYDRTLLEGLDYALAEIGRRGMKAVVYLTNFWEWSGGMMTYLSWTNGGRYLNMNDPAHPWPAFPDFNAEFYRSGAAIGLYHDYVRALVGRTNSITRRGYADDPAIMAWQLANEPRPGGSEAVGTPNLPNFYSWIGRTATLIKSIDANHLVSTGSEGLKGCLESETCVVSAHRAPGIDYLTAHIWPLNWSWVDSANLAGTWDAGAEKVSEYIRQHIAMARTLRQPLVIEEFGFPRDGGSYDPAAATTFKDRFYRLVYDAVYNDARAGGPAAGTNFWAWNGEGRAAHADHRFRPGDTAYLGDPPHEPQGWYGVFGRDASTKRVIADHARALAALPA